MSAPAGRDRHPPRPAGVPWMLQSWQRLAFLHWEAPAEALSALLPAGISLDTYEGRAFVGLVPFTVRGARAPLTPALPWVSNFHEVNVRTYVHRGGEDFGIYFFSLDVTRAAAALGARAAYGLRYHHARIDFTREGDSERFACARRWTGPAGCDLRWTPKGPAAPAAPGTLEHFLVERYVLYAVRGGALVRARVHHAPYPLQAAEAAAVSETLIAAAGIHRGGEAPLAHAAARVDVQIFGPQRVG